MANTSIDHFLPVTVTPRETGDSPRAKPSHTELFNDQLRRASDRDERLERDERRDRLDRPKRPERQDEARSKHVSNRQTSAPDRDERTSDRNDQRGDSKAISSPDHPEREEPAEKTRQPSATTEEKESSYAPSGGTIEILHDDTNQEELVDPNVIILQDTIPASTQQEGMVNGESLTENEETGAEIDLNDTSESNDEADTSQQRTEPVTPTPVEDGVLTGQSTTAGQLQPSAGDTESQTDGPQASERSKDTNQADPKASEEGRATTLAQKMDQAVEADATTTPEAATDGGTSQLAGHDETVQIPTQASLGQTSITAPSSGQTGDPSDHKPAQDQSRQASESTDRGPSITDPAAPAEGQLERPTQITTDALPPAAGVTEDTSPASRLDHLSPQSRGAIDRLSVGRTLQPSSGPEEGERTLPIDRTRFGQRVGGAIRLAQQRDGQVQLRLSPPELGSLKIEISVKQGALTATLETETVSARNALLDNLPALRERLAEQNIRIEQFDVDLNRDGQQETDGQALQERGQRGSQERSHPDRANESEVPEQAKTNMPSALPLAVDPLLDGLDVVA